MDTYTDDNGIERCSTCKDDAAVRAAARALWED